MSDTFQRLRLCLLAGAISLAGCVNDHGLDTQGEALDPHWLGASQALAGISLTPAAWPQRDWWRQLGDPQLDELVEEALRDSPDMRIAEARSHQAFAAAAGVDAQQSGSLDGSASVQRARFNREQDPLGEGDAYSTSRNLQASFNYSFDLWGGDRAAWEAALGRARATEIDHQAAGLTLAADVSRAYSRLAQAYILMDLAEEDLKRTGQMLTLAQRRHTAGIDSDYQLQQTQSLQATSQEQAIDAEKQLASARIALSVLLGKGPDRGVALRRPNVLKPGAVQLPPTLPAELLGRRPDLVAARWRVEAASQDIVASKTRFYPNLDLNAAAGTESILGDALFGGASRFWNIAPSLSLPIYDGGRRRANLDARDADYDLAVAQYNKSLVRALGDVSDSIVQLRALNRQIEASQQAANAAKSSFDSASQRYGAGIGSFVDALTVEQQLLQAQRQLASLNADRVDQSIQLMQALGGGFRGDRLAQAPSAYATPTE